MSTNRRLAIAATVLIVAACNPFHREPAVEVSTDDSMLNTRWHANLASPAELAGVVQMNGSASMAPTTNGNSTHVEIDLANASPGGVHPWALHRGQCGAGMDDGVLGSRDAFEPLEVGSDGKAHRTASVETITPRTGRYFVQVSASMENRDVVVACGNLAAPTR